jgi:hypothetical protein
MAYPQRYVLGPSIVGTTTVRKRNYVQMRRHRSRDAGESTGFHRRHRQGRRMEAVRRRRSTVRYGRTNVVTSVELSV